MPQERNKAVKQTEDSNTVARTRYSLSKEAAKQIKDLWPGDGDPFHLSRVRYSTQVARSVGRGGRQRR